MPDNPLEAAAGQIVTAVTGALGAIASIPQGAEATVESVLDKVKNTVTDIVNAIASAANPKPQPPIDAAAVMATIGAAVANAETALNSAGLVIASATLDVTMATKQGNGSADTKLSVQITPKPIG